jgi:hypothetical protein
MSQRFVAYSTLRKQGLLRLLKNVCESAGFSYVKQKQKIKIAVVEGTVVITLLNSSVAEDRKEEQERGSTMLLSRKKKYKP